MKKDYDDAMWTKEHAEEISRISKSRIFKVLCFTIIFCLLSFVCVFIYGLYLAISK